MSANERQVAGNHYKSAYQHWDWAIDVNLRNVEYAASKYLDRLGEKDDPVTEAGKVVHYLEKLLEAVEAGRIQSNKAEHHRLQKTAQYLATRKGMQPEAMAICLILASWQYREDIMQAITIARALVARAHDIPWAGRPQSVARGPIIAGTGEPFVHHHPYVPPLMGQAQGHVSADAEDIMQLGVSSGDSLA